MLNLFPGGKSRPCSGFFFGGGGGGGCHATIPQFSSKANKYIVAELQDLFQTDSDEHILRL